MGEQSWVVFKVGGAATKDVWDGLLELCEDRWSEGEDAETLLLAAKEGHVLSFHGEQSWGNCDEEEQYCRQHGLTFHSSYASVPGQYDSGVRYWNPTDGGNEADGNDEGEPTIGLAALRDWRDRVGWTLDRVIEELAKADSSRVPPVTIVEG